MEYINEKAPPDPEIEDWIKKNKQRFIDEYGEEEGTKILYSAAWKMHDKKQDESEDFDEEDLEAVMEIWDSNRVQESMDLIDIWTEALDEASDASHDEVVREELIFEEYQDEPIEEIDRKERKRRSRQMKRSAKKMSRQKKKKKPLTRDRIKGRARKRAREEIKKKASGGKSSSDMSAAEKKRAEKKTSRMSKKVDRLAKRKEKEVRKSR